MKKYYIYILLCSDDSFYVGITNDIERRLGEHQSGSNETSYTSQRLPVELVHIEVFQYVEDAIERETKLKKWSHKKKLALINGDLRLLKDAARKKNWSSHVPR